MNIKPDTKMRRVNGVELKLNSINTVEISFSGQSLIMNNNTLVLMNLFAYPTSIKEVIGSLNIIGAQHWIAVSNTVTALYNMGVLVDASETEVVRDVKNTSYGAAAGQIFMLNDKLRTDYFIGGINEIVKEGDVVLDIGTGTGVLAIAAARAGARKVYAIEASGIADVAQEIIEKAGVGDKVEIIRGWSTNVTIPEKANVLVSEMLGNDPLGESILNIFKDARERLLKEDAVVLPGRIKVMSVEVSIPDDILHNKVLKESDLEHWKDWYNIDFSALKKVATPITNPLLYLTTKQAEKVSITSEPILLADINLNDSDQTFIDVTLELNKGTGSNAILLYFDTELGSFDLSTHPKKAGISNHWTNPIYYLTDLEKIQDGETYKLKYKYDNNNKSSISIFSE